MLLFLPGTLASQLVYHVVINVYKFINFVLTCGQKLHIKVLIFYRFNTLQQHFYGANKLPVKLNRNYYRYNDKNFRYNKVNPVFIENIKREPQRNQVQYDHKKDKLSPQLHRKGWQIYRACGIRHCV